MEGSTINPLAGVPDSDLIAELRARGYEVFKWEEEPEWK